MFSLPPKSPKISCKMGKHLTLSQRYTISVLKKQQMSQKDIALIIGRDKSVISRELSRNKDNRSDKYRFDLAQRKCNIRHAEKPKHIRFTDEIKEQVIKALENKYSPEQITGRFRLENKNIVSHETIYRFVWQNKKNGGELYTNLRNRGKKYRKRGCKKDKRGSIQNRVDIDMRPAIVEKKERFGDFEADTIIGKNHKKAMMTLNDRATGYGFIRKLESKDANILASKAIHTLYKFQNYTHTITSDNGHEFAKHEKIAKTLNIDFYFAKPYHSWERGANENYNRLVRQYFPKGMDFDKITFGEIRKVQNELNNRPRKRLAFFTPKEILEKLNIFSKVAFIT